MHRAKWNLGAVVLIALAAAAGAALFVLRSSFRGTEEDAARRSAIESSSSVAPRSGSGSGIDLESAPEVEASPAKTTPRELPDGVWIHGRVVVPAGTPPDEKVEIAARVLSFDDAPGYVAEMGADGKFAVMFPKEVDSGWIEIHARYLVLEPNQAVDLEEPPEEIVLEPVLGGRVTGRIIGPSRGGSEIRALAGSFVELSAKTDPGFPRFHSRRIRVDGDLRFEFLALPPISGYELGVNAKDLLPFERDVEIRPGRSTEAEIELHLGARISGRVVDADGKPVGGSAVWRTEEPPGGAPKRLDPDAVSGADGVFGMTAIPPGVMTITVIAAGHLPEIVEIGRLEDGDVRGDIEIRLRPGLIHGRVEWPDGSPAIDAVVETTDPITYRDGSIHVQPEHLRSDVYDSGRFEIEVSTDAPHSVFARSPAQPGVDPGDLSSEGESGFARVDGIQPSTLPTVIVLEPAPIVRGRVTDDVGNPITRFTVIGSRSSRLGTERFGRRFQEEFENRAGEYALAGLEPGPWRFLAMDDEQKGRTVPVELPNGGAPIVLVVPRSAAVSGIVLDPEGHPVAGAEIRSMSKRKNVSAEDGRFELPDLPAGSNLIWADAPFFARSEPVRLEVQPGGSESGARLVLRRGGTVVCDVLDGERHPEPGRTILIRSAGGHRWGSTMSSEASDGDGQVVFENLAPGPYSLSKMITPQETLAEADPGPKPWTRFAASNTQASVDVVAGEVAHVAIGGPKGSPVRVHGRVTDAGAPVPGIEVGGSKTDANGRFDLLVPEPGYVELVLLLEDRGLELRTWRRIAGGPGENLDLTLPRGRISGVVRSGDGRPLDGVQIRIQGDGLATSIGAWSTNGAWQTTAGGRFSFRNLPASRYELSSFTEGIAPGDDLPTTELTLEEGGSLDDLVIRLP